MNLHTVSNLHWPETRSNWTPRRIASRWTPEHVVRLDTKAGFFEEVNPRMDSLTELQVQRALLAKQQTSTPARAIYLGIAVVFGCALLAHLIARNA